VLEYLHQVDTGYVLVDPATFKEFVVPIWLGGKLLGELKPSQRVKVGCWQGWPVHFEWV
jgi:hypothetical protein